MSLITINTIYSRISSPEAISAAREEFKYRTEGYFRTAAYKQGRWDGYAHPININGSFGTGMLPYVSNFLYEAGFEFDLLDERPNELSPVEIDTEFLREYQREMVEQVLDFSYCGIPFYRGIISGATNAGKTYMSVALWRAFDKPNCIFLVHRVKLYDQQLKFFQEQLGSHVVGQINDKIQDSKKPFVVAMYRGALNVNLRRFKMVIVDEGHMAKGALYKKVVNRLKADVRYYISGTPFKIDEKGRYGIIASSGPELARISNRELIDLGYSAEPKIFMQTIHNDVDPFIKYPYAYEDYIIQNKERNQKIQKFVVSNRSTRSCWVICRRVHHAQLLANLLSAELLTGQTKKKDATAIIDGFIEQKIRVVVSTMVIDVGMNLPIEAFVVALGGKSEVDILQLMGRALRMTEKHKDVLVLDFYDIGPYVEEHSTQRKRIYEEEQFETILI